MKKFAGDTTDCESGFISLEDTSCEVYCECGCDENIWVSNDKIIRCPNCGKGYRTEFVVWQYDVDEEWQED